MYAEIPQTGWRIIIIEPIRSVYDVIIKISIAFIIGLIVMVFSSYLSASMLLKRLLSPIRLLQNASDLFKKGNFQVPELDFYSIEFNKLKNDFIDMGQTIHHRELRLKQMIDEKDILLKEVHHRVKNNIQVLSSLLNLQMMSVDEPRYEALMVSSMNRINTMGLVHQKLYDSESFRSVSMSEYIDELSDQLLHIYNAEEKVIVTLEAGSVELSINEAIPLGLFLNELISNSLKYG